MLKLTYAQVKAALACGFKSPLNSVKKISKVFTNKFNKDSSDEATSIHKKIDANVGLILWGNTPDGFAKAVMSWRCWTTKGLVLPFPRKRDFK